MKKISLPIFAFAALAGLSANAATTYLSNNFDGIANDIGPAFQEVNNGNPTSQNTTDPATGLINFTRSGSQPNIGFGSVSTMDLSGEQGFTITWDVTSATIADIRSNGWFFGVTDNTSSGSPWNSNSNDSFGVALNATGDGKSAFDLVTVDSGTKAYTNLATGPTDASLVDGFTVSMTLMADESWSVTTTGLSTDVTEATGTAAAGTYASIADSLVATSVWQGRGSTPNIAQYDSVLLVSVPEPSSFALIGGALALTSVMLRRRRS